MSKNYIEESKRIFEKIALKYGLQYKHNEQDPVEASVTLPKQKNLDFEIWLCLQNNDELWIVANDCTISMFPFEKVTNQFEDYLSSIIEGKSRYLRYHHSKNAKSYKCLVQNLINNEWNTFFTYTSGLFPFSFGKAHTTIIQNRYNLP